MLGAILAVVCTALVAFCLFQYFAQRVTKKQLAEYRALFELGDQGLKEAQNKIEFLLEDASQRDQGLREAQNRIEFLLEDAGQRNVLIERGANALTLANSNLQEQVALLKLKNDEVETLKETIGFQEGQYGKLIGQKKSSEVRLGQVTEQLAPFLADYPLNPENARFIGAPIDIISFDKDKITFIEVKSGKSQLSKKQRQIRDMIKEGKVDFLVYRIEGKS